MALGPRARILILSAVVLIALATLIWVLSTKSRTTPVTPVVLPPADEPHDTPSPQEIVTPLAPPSTTQRPLATPSTSPAIQSTPETRSNQSATPPSTLLIPVAGMRPEQLQDTYSQARSEGRTHNALDIMAPRGTPVVATADGTIIKLFQSERGGLTIYQLSTDNKMVYYYAHLDRYADGLAEKQFARQGQVIGYVGDTGNAGAGNYHLHFAIWTITDPKQY